MISSPEKKRKKKTARTTKKSSTTPNPSLPEDLLLSCLARVSGSYYPILSLVSKSFRSLLTSHELYRTRSLLNPTETCLYVCLRFPDPMRIPRWFTLCPKPTLTNDTRQEKNNKSSGFVLATVSIPPRECFCLVVVGSNIYNIGKSFCYSSSVSVLDCRSKTWCKAPSMQVKREAPAVNVFDGKIYVAGGCKDYNNTSTWMEVFDPKMQTWEFVSFPSTDICKIGTYKSAVIDGEIYYYMFGGESVAYNPKEGKWKPLRSNSDTDLGWGMLSHYVIDNILYSYSIQDGIKWYDSKIGRWRRLMGLKGLPIFADHSHVQLADYGGKLAVFWDKYLPASGYDDKRIWCALIALERRNDMEMWGMVEWLDVVLTFPKSYKFVCALSPTV